MHTHTHTYIYMCVCTCTCFLFWISSISFKVFYRIGFDTSTFITTPERSTLNAQFFCGRSCEIAWMRSQGSLQESADAPLKVRGFASLDPWKLRSENVRSWNTRLRTIHQLSSKTFAREILFLKLRKYAHFQWFVGEKFCVCVCVCFLHLFLFFLHLQSVSLLNWVAKFFKCWSHRSCLWLHQHTKDWFRNIFFYGRVFFLQIWSNIWLQSDGEFFNIAGVSTKRWRQIQPVSVRYAYKFIASQTCGNRTIFRYFCWSGQVTATSSTRSFSLE